MSIAGLYTPVATCEARGINPLADLADVIPRVQDHPKRRLDEYCPGRGREPRPSDIADGNRRRWRGSADAFHFAFHLPLRELDPLRCHVAMNEERNKAVVARFDELGNGTGDLDTLDELCTPDMVNHALAASAAPGLEGSRNFLRKA